MDRNAIVRLGLDLQKGVKTFSYEDKEYTANEAQDILRQALVDANGGSTTFNYKTLRRNKAAIFEIIEELVSVIVMEGLKGSEFWNNYVDYRNLKLGDKNEFYVEDESFFVVSEVADGHFTPRRQRLGATSTYSVTTKIQAIRIYDHFSRFMAGRIDWAILCNKVAEAFQKKIWAEIYAAFSGIASNGAAGSYPYPNSNYFVTASGSNSDDDLLGVIGHVEAATGQKAVIFGVAPALKKLSSISLSNASETAKDDMYNQGFYGKFYGTDAFKVDQVHKIGTDTFMLEQNAIYVVAGDDKFIKFVDEGETIIDDRDYTQNADGTMEYRMTQKFGAGVQFASKSLGKYTLV